jgi:hypothetical protein
MVRGLFNALDNALNHFDPEVVVAAKDVREVLKTYGRKIIKEEYNQETSSLRNMTNDLLSPLYIDAVKKAGLFDWVNEIVKQNNNFIDLYKKRNDKEANKSEAIHKESRAKTDVALNATLEFIEALILIEGEEKYADFVRKFNVMLSNFGTPSRPTKPEVETPAEEPTTPETPAEDYPEAIEWVANFGVANATDGMIFYVMVDGEKVFYKLLDRAGVGFVPGGDKYQELWEKLS